MTPNPYSLECVEPVLEALQKDGECFGYRVINGVWLRGLGTALCYADRERYMAMCAELEEWLCRHVDVRYLRIEKWKEGNDIGWQVGANVRNISRYDTERWSHGASRIEALVAAVLAVRKEKQCK